LGLYMWHYICQCVCSWMTLFYNVPYEEKPHVLNYAQLLCDIIV